MPLAGEPSRKNSAKIILIDCALSDVPQRLARAAFENVLENYSYRLTLFDPEELSTIPKYRINVNKTPLKDKWGFEEHMTCFCRGENQPHLSCSVITLCPRTFKLPIPHIVQILAHEIGHSFGLSHSKSSRSIMHASQSKLRKAVYFSQSELKRIDKRIKRDWFMSCRQSQIGYFPEN